MISVLVPRRRVVERQSVLVVEENLRLTHSLQRHQLETLLQTKRLDAERRLGLERRLAEVAVWLAPPVFDRPRGHEQHA